MILKITRNNRHSLSFSWMDLDPFFRLIIKFEANFSPNDGNGCNETLKNFRIFIFILFLVLALVGNLNYLFYTYKLLCFIILLKNMNENWSFFLFALLYIPCHYIQYYYHFPNNIFLWHFHVFYYLIFFPLWKDYSIFRWNLSWLLGDALKFSLVKIVFMSEVIYHNFGGVSLRAWKDNLKGFLINL